MKTSIPTIVLALAIALLLAAPFAFFAGRRGGRFRAMPGWIGFWVFFSGLLVCLSRAPLWLSFPVLAALMFVGLKQYFFLAPVRPQDRWAILVTYLSVPAALAPVYFNSVVLFEALAPVGLFLLLPALLAMGARGPGLLDSMGRVLVGALVFVFGGGHLGLMAHQPGGLLELFAILVLFVELPQRLVGRPRPGEILRSASGVLLAVALGAAIGWWLGPLASVERQRGLVAGLIVAGAVTAGALVADAVSQDLSLDVASQRIGRGAFLDRAVPALYAAPVYYLYLSQLR